MYSRKGYMDETYEILGYLGSGSGGVIYKAYHKRLQKEVVLKKIKRKSRDARINRNEKEWSVVRIAEHRFLPTLDFAMYVDQRLKSRFHQHRSREQERFVRSVRRR